MKEYYIVEIPAEKPKGRKQTNSGNLFCLVSIVNIITRREGSTDTEDCI
jgi:hypothetical protein